MVKAIIKQEVIEIPEKVTLKLNAKVIKVEGTKGTLTRSFKTMPIQIHPTFNE